MEIFAPGIVENLIRQLPPRGDVGFAPILIDSLLARRLVETFQGSDQGKNVRIRGEQLGQMEALPRSTRMPRHPLAHLQPVEFGPATGASCKGPLFGLALPGRWPIHLVVLDDDVGSRHKLTFAARTTPNEPFPLIGFQPPFVDASPLVSGSRDGPHLGDATMAKPFAGDRWRSLIHLVDLIQDHDVSVDRLQLWSLAQRPDLGPPAV